MDFFCFFYNIIMHAEISSINIQINVFIYCSFLLVIHGELVQGILDFSVFWVGESGCSESKLSTIFWGDVWKFRQRKNGMWYRNFKDCFLHEIYRLTFFEICYIFLSGHFFLFDKVWRSEIELIGFKNQLIRVKNTGFK